MIKIAIDVNVKGLEALEGLLNMIKTEEEVKAPMESKAVTVELPQAVKPAVAPITSTEPVTPVAPQEPTVPTAKQAYEFSEIQKCCAPLAQNAETRVKLQAILNNDFGVPGIKELPKESYNDFVVKLREIGGVI